MTGGQDQQAQQAAADYLNTVQRRRNQGGEIDLADRAAHEQRCKSDDPSYREAVQQYKSDLDWLANRLNCQGTYKARARQVTDPCDDFNLVATQWEVSHWSRLKRVLKEVAPQDHKRVNDIFAAYARSYGLLDETFLARREERLAEIYAKRGIAARSPTRWSGLGGNPNQHGQLGGNGCAPPSARLFIGKAVEARPPRLVP